MKLQNSRREFLTKSSIAGLSALSLSLPAFSANQTNAVLPVDHGSKLIVPAAQGLKITGTFLDEISHDIPHQNWGGKGVGHRFCPYEGHRH